MYFWSWTQTFYVGVILISSTQFLQTDCATINQLLTLRSLTTLKPTPPPIGKINPFPSNSGSKLVVDYGFKGMTYDRTESSLYPTTPPEDKEFEKWEAQEEAKHAQLAKLKLVSANSNQLSVNKSVAALIEDDTLTPSVESEPEMDTDFYPLLSERQEMTDNEKTVASFFGNQVPPKKTEPYFPNFNFPRLSETFSMKNRMSPMIDSFRKFFGTGTALEASVGPDSINSTGISSKTSTQTPLLMNIIKSIRIPTMTPDGGAKFQAQMQKFRENWQQRDILGAVNETLNIANPILMDPVPLRSVLAGIADFVRCNTVGRLNNGNSICN